MRPDCHISSLGFGLGGRSKSCLLLARNPKPGKLLMNVSLSQVCGGLRPKPGPCNSLWLRALASHKTLKGQRNLPPMLHADSSQCKHKPYPEAPSRPAACSIFPPVRPWEGGTSACLSLHPGTPRARGTGNSPRTPKGRRGEGRRRIKWLEKSLPLTW